MDLEAYFRRIGYDGPAAPTLGVLDAIVFGHVTTIPFENLAVAAREPVAIDLDAIERKLVGERRGGYCFELNALLLAALSAIGFDATPLSGRVRLQVPRDVTPPRTHLFLRVRVDGIDRLADGGVGGASPAATLRLDVDAEQPTPHEPRRIVDHDGRRFHQMRVAPGDGPDAWADVVEFTGEPMPAIDRELANHWTSTHPNSKFRQNLMVALARPDGTRVAILNRQFTHRRGPTILETRRLASPADLRDVLAAEFGLDVPPTMAFDVPNLTWDQ